MQLIEIIIFLLTIIMLRFLIKHKSIKNKYVSVLSVIIIVSLILHIILEETRWQIYPLYLAMVLCIGMATVFIFRFKEFQMKKNTRRSIIILSGILILISAISSFAFPVYDMPLPSGDYSIGTESFILTDTNREEIYGTQGDRKIKIQFWYPAESTEGYELTPWLEDGRVVAQALANDFGLPTFILNHTELISSNSYKEAPISEAIDEYPVVVISHGWRGFRNLHTDLAEELASLGYIVVNIDHTYGSVATVFSEDEIAYVNLEALPDREKTPDFLDYANTLVSTYAGDISFTLDEMEKMNTGVVLSQFEGKIDLTSIGLLGHSTGGGADVAVAINDVRIKALIGMDAWVESIYDTEIDKGLDIPALFLRSGSWEEGFNNTNLLRLVDESNGSSLLYQIDGTIHYDFSMAYMYSPLTKYLGITGELEGEYLVSILEGMIVNFFDQHLKEDSSTDINTLVDTWEEVRKIE